MKFILVPNKKIFKQTFVSHEDFYLTNRIYRDTIDIGLLPSPWGKSPILQKKNLKNIKFKYIFFYCDP